MRRFVNDDEAELSETGASVIKAGDRLMVHTSEGTESAVAIRDGEATLVSYRGRTYRVERTSRRRGEASTAASGDLRAPMPGSIVDVRVSEGATVAKGDVILVLEAMKTQQPFRAPFDGRVTALAVKVGDQVAENAPLATVVAA